MIIRNYTIDDIHAIKDLFKLSLGYEVSFDDLRNRIAIMLESKNYKILVAEDNEEVIGFIGLQKSLCFEDPGIVLRIIALGVSNKYQGKGIGTKLIEGAEEYAKENNISVLLVNSGLKRLQAHNFYEKNLFNKKGYSFVKKL